MPIKLGNTNISTIYKGTTPISAIYKGTTLLYQSASWELYSKTYFYNELVPTTINSKNVLNKAKIVKVSGNGVIENQLVQNGNFEDGSHWTVGGGTVSFSNNKATLTIGTGGNIEFYQPIQKQTGHKYIATFKAKTSYAQSLKLNWGATLNTFSLTTSEQVFSVLVNTLSGNNNLNFTNTGLWAGSTIEIRDAQLIDLTLMFGTGNEPTTLTDNRIQNILNRGYIAFNLGKYKESDIGVVSSEPYNLLNLDNNVDIGFFVGGTIISTLKYCLYTPNYIDVLPNTSYTFSGSSDFQIFKVEEYDENKNFIKESDGGSGSGKNTYTLTLTSNTRFVRLTFANLNNQVDYTNIGIPSADTTQACFHLTGTRTGYAEHKTFTPITFKAQLGGAINSHNTMEITNSAYVFTRNVWKYTFNGSENFTRAGTNVSGVYRYWFYGLSNVKGYANSQIADILCDNLTADTNDHIYLATNDYSIGIFADGGFDLIVKSITDVATMQSFMNGKTMHYPLATPQVITIPRKHLGIVDLGSLTGYVSNDKYFISAEFFGITTASSNNNGYSCYCEDYMIDSGYNVYNKTTDKTMCLTSPFIGGNFIIWDSSFVGKTAQEIKALLSGKYLFYETESEVADITNVIDIESGGTITTDSEVLPNIELSVKCK